MFLLISLCRICRVVKGMDVVHAIEKTKTDKNEKPYEDIKIMNITLHDNVDV